MSTQTRPLPATNKQPPNNPPKGWAKAGVNGPNNANGASPTISRALPKQPNQYQRTSSPTAAPPKGLAKSTAVPIPKRPRNIQSSVQLPNSLPNASELRNGMNRTVGQIILDRNLSAVFSAANILEIIYLLIIYYLIHFTVGNFLQFFVIDLIAISTLLKIANTSIVYLRIVIISYPPRYLHHLLGKPA